MGRVEDIKETFPRQKIILQRRGRPDPWLKGSAKRRCAALHIRNDWRKRLYEACDQTVNQAIQAMVFDEEQIIAGICLLLSGILPPMAYRTGQCSDDH